MNPPEESKTVKLNIPFPAELVEALDHLAKESGTTRDELINEAITEYIEEHEDK